MQICNHNECVGSETKVFMLQLIQRKFSKKEAI